MPPFLRLLAFIGVLIGSTSAMFSVSVGHYFLADRDEFLSPVRQQLAALPTPSPTPSPSPSPSPGPNSALESPLGLAELLYDHRGAVLPLAAICFILSSLLLAGCVRSLAGSAWGASAWKTACAVWLPIQVFITLVGLVGAGPPGLVVVSLVSCGYCATSVWYLRRPEIAARFK